MRKLIAIMAIALLFANSAFAVNSYKNRTVKGFTSSQLIKTGNVELYKITFVATANTANWTIYDCLSAGAGTNANVKTEGSEATSGNGKCYDFGDEPIECSTGAYIVINSMNVIIEYI